MNFIKRKTAYRNPLQVEGAVERWFTQSEVCSDSLSLRTPLATSRSSGMLFLCFVAEAFLRGLTGFVLLSEPWASIFSVQISTSSETFLPLYLAYPRTSSTIFSIVSGVHLFLFSVCERETELGPTFIAEHWEEFGGFVGSKKDRLYYQVYSVLEEWWNDHPDSFMAQCYRETGISYKKIKRYLEEKEKSKE